MKRLTAPLLVGLAAMGVVATVGVAMLGSDTELFSTSEECTAEVDGRRVALSLEQAENASLISAIAVRRDLPARAASIALATAYQESDLFNIEYGDRDSVGLFQQRPSQGWGSVDEILDPVYSTNAFYDALLEIDGYESMEITAAAQAVQRSGFPDAYADHEGDARTIASALTGHSPEGFTCEISDDVDEVDPALTRTGLTKRAEAVRREALGVFGDVQVGGFEPGGVGDGHMSGSTHYEGRAVDLFVRPINGANKVRGWAMAHYFVAQAARLEIQTVIFDDRIWTARRSDEGWRNYDPPSRDGDQVILEHRDHVHVDVFA
ncbi:MAG: hypothetical protein M3237_15735 [Actinomycetota bacterium]|nr:hypothetical protein [Actinomycetota bacterium]